jgi:hypothetical protein
VSRLRYFTYISDAKVDVLLAQIPHQHKEKIAAEIGFNLGVLSGKVVSETTTLESRVSRVLAVERYIRDKASGETLGTPSLPRAWIEGSALATAGNVGKGALLYVFSGKTWYFALAGSAKHLAGVAAPQEVDAPFSFLPDIVKTLSRLMDGEPTKLVSFWDESLKQLHNAGIPTGFADEWFRVIRYFATNGQNEGTPQNISFLALRLASELWEGKLVTIASPLYIETIP